MSKGQTGTLTQAPWGPLAGGTQDFQNTLNCLTWQPAVKEAVLGPQWRSQTERGTVRGGLSLGKDGGPEGAMPATPGVHKLSPRVSGALLFTG